jgi:Cd(II)/Pb(II)-responsive transcriptional regulator
MNIGRLAAASGTTVETIRWYERIGLLPPAVRRAGSNYRVYDAARLERLRFIRHCRALDMTLDEVRSLLALRDAPADDCTDVNALIDRHVDHVRVRIAELQHLHEQLQALRARCTDAKALTECGILTALAAETADTQVRTAHGATSSADAACGTGGVHRPFASQAKRR